VASKAQPQAPEIKTERRSEKSEDECLTAQDDSVDILDIPLTLEKLANRIKDCAGKIQTRPPICSMSKCLACLAVVTQ
jgi:hypothetical protein